MQVGLDWPFSGKHLRGVVEVGSHDVVQEASDLGSKSEVSQLHRRLSVR